MDLVAINIQRGREHGIPDYNSVRVLCGLPRANSFEDLVNDMEANVLHIKQILALLLLLLGDGQLVMNYSCADDPGFAESLRFSRRY